MLIKVPGKLFVLGEYNVLNSGHSAIVMAVNRMMSLDFKASDHFAISSRYGNSLDELPHAKAAYEICQLYFSYLGKSLPTYNISITSDLDYGDKKLGMGSSGAVMVGIIKGYLDFLGNYDPYLILKLSILADISLGKPGSGADMAAMIFGGVIGYRRYDLGWVMEGMDDLSILDKEWPLLRVTQGISLPSFLVGWTQSPHRSLLSKSDVSESLYLKAEALVEKAIDAAKVSLLDIHDYQQWMDEFEKYSGRLIRTPLLSTLLDIATRCGGVGKISGAGGGDCGLLFEVVNQDLCYSLLNKNGIVALDIEVYEYDSI